MNTWEHTIRIDMDPRELESYFVAAEWPVEIVSSRLHLAPEPPDDAWFTVDGVEWATNGQFMVARDGGPRPRTAMWLNPDHAQWPGHNRSTQQDAVAHIVHGDAPIPLTVGDERDHEPGHESRFKRCVELLKPDGERLCIVRPSFVEMLHGLDLRGSGSKAAIYARRAGQLVAVAMPLYPDWERR